VSQAAHGIRRNQPFAQRVRGDPNNVTEDVLPTGRVGRLCPLLVGVSAQAPEPLIHERLRTRVPDIHRPTAERFAKLDYSHPVWGPLLIGRFARLRGPDPLIPLGWCWSVGLGSTMRLAVRVLEPDDKPRGEVVRGTKTGRN
jgi:hypothetical protein